MADPTSWDGFSNKVFNGTIRLNVDDGVADLAAQHAADLLAAVATVTGKRVTGRLSEGQTAHSPLGGSFDTGYGYKGFGQLDSGRAMTSIFSKLDNDLGDALNAQVKILEEMGNAFSCAAKGYKATDDESKQYFDSLRNSHGKDTPYSDIQGAVYSFNGYTKAGIPKTDDWGDGKTPKNFNTDHKGTQAADSGSKSQYLLSLESSQSITGKQIELLANVGITNGVELVESGAVWKSWANFLQGKFATFNQDIAGMRSKEQWTGPGIDSIINALNSYITQATTLVETMWAVGDLLNYSGGWISTTREAAATAHYDHKDDERKMCEEFRPIFQSVYHFGWQETFNSVPSIPSPSALVSPFTPSTPQQPNVPGGNNPSGGTPSSPGTPTTDQPNLDGKQPESPTSKDPNTTKQPTSDDTLKTIAQEVATTVQTVAQQLSSAVSTGVQGLESVAQQVATTVQQQLSAQTTKQTDDKQTQLDQQLTNLSSLLNPGGSPATPGSTPGSPGGTPTSPKSPESPKSQSFPRSTVATDEQQETLTSTSRAGIATSSTSSSGASSMPGMGSMGQAGGAQGQSKEHKRPTFLTSAEHFEEVVGEAPAAVTPVAEK
ncbi:hypothetical protein [Nocardia concava]|uniref:hypothetical protein n=1 Tax=Nocardia concava TaxID=257281 RepID=UPI00031E50EC|nr:hypothetical protein [Nocardia concava]